MTAPPYMLVQASANAIPLADESVQCVVTSPPYWGLRQYAGEQRQVWGGDGSHGHVWGAEVGTRTSSPQQSRNGAQGVVGPRGMHPSAGRTDFAASLGNFCDCGAWHGALGLEPTPEMYVAHMVEVFREVRRVLRRDGTLWLNLGDSYAANWSSVRSEGGGGFKDVARERNKHAPAGMKAKDLVGIPWMVAFALRADGWYLRSDIIWSKPNPMPESVTDRPTKSHEYVFLLTKSERYYYDADAIREPVAESSIQRVSQNGGRPKFEAARARREGGHITGRDTLRADQLVPAGGRNARSVWEIATTPYPGAHFATFPEELPRRCIMAGSAPQACGVCGAPWGRVFERSAELDESGKGSYFDRGKTGARDGGDRTQPGVRYRKVATDWRPTCEHADGSGRSLVLDPFNGSGTTGAVAVRLGRAYVGLDISAEYLREQAVARIDPLGAAALAASDAADNGGEAQGVLAL